MSVTLTQYPIEWSNPANPDQKSIFEWKLGSSIFKGCFKSLSIGDTHVGLGPQPGKSFGFWPFWVGFLSDTIIIDLKGYGLNQEGVWNLNDDQCITETGCFDVEGFCTDSGINPWYVANFFFAKMN